MLTALKKCLIITWRTDAQGTGQAFEDMQEQNSRLIQQLREKDDANFKLMSERIKAQQVHKLPREEKDMLVEQVGRLGQRRRRRRQRGNALL